MRILECVEGYNLTPEFNYKAAFPPRSKESITRVWTPARSIGPLTRRAVSRVGVGNLLCVLVTSCNSNAQLGNERFSCVYPWITE